MIQALEDHDAASAGVAGAALGVSLIDHLHRKGVLSELDVSEILIFARMQLILAMPAQLHEALSILDGFRGPSVAHDSRGGRDRPPGLPARGFPALSDRPSS